MKKGILYMSILCATIFSSCKKDDSCGFTESGASAPAAERTQLADYLAAASISATEHSSGAYYIVHAPGTGTVPNICSGITVKYTGTLFPSGTQFDASTSSSGVTFPLGNLIVGWQKLLPLIKAGGSISMFIPPTLGYGYQNVPPYGNVIIPAGSYLRFDVELLSVQ